MAQYALAHKLTLETMTCGECGLVFAAPDYFWARRRETGEGWSCPNGHRRIFSDSEVDRLRKMLEDANRSKTALAQRNGELLEEKKKAETQLKRTKTIAKKTMDRIQAGVCPCCNRTFQNLARHMATKHKDVTQ